MLRAKFYRLQSTEPHAPRKKEREAVLIEKNTQLIWFLEITTKLIIEDMDI